jgi:Fe-S-cluster containining protein
VSSDDPPRPPPDAPKIAFAGGADEGSPEVEADVLEDIQRVVDDLAGRTDSADLVARLDYIVDLLIMRGHLKPGHRRLLNKVRADRSTVFLAMFPDKRKVVGPDIDCPSLIHLCKARCCSYSVTLSPQDIAENRLRWELYEPYRLAKDRTTGYCRYLRADAGCSAYEDRPATCRLYDCREDRRVWLDWDNKIPAPMPDDAGVIPLGEWPPPPVTPADDAEDE